MPTYDIPSLSAVARWRDGYGTTLDGGVMKRASIDDIKKKICKLSSTINATDGAALEEEWKDIIIRLLKL